MRKVKKSPEKFKKGIDKKEMVWYYRQAPSRAPNLENDTEKKKRKETTVDSEERVKNLAQAGN